MKKQDISAPPGKEDAFKLIGNQWMLVTSGTEDKFNPMTASWGVTPTISLSRTSD